MLVYQSVRLDPCCEIVLSTVGKINNPNLLWTVVRKVLREIDNKPEDFGQDSTSTHEVNYYHLSEWIQFGKS